MHTLKTTISILLLLCISASVLSQKSDKDDGTILLGRNYGFILKEPNGWVMDDAAAKSQNLEAVLYREGSSWKLAVAVMYARVVNKDANTTVEQVISDDVADFLKRSPESKVSDSPGLTTRDRKISIVKGFYDGANKNYDSVAFIDEPKVVVVLALSSRDKNEFEKSLPAFKALIGSYFSVKGLFGSALETKFPNPSLISPALR